MKYTLFLHAFLLLFAISSFSQVGIGTITPNAQLDIRSSSQATPLNIDGILIPKIDKFPTINPTSLQDGMMVYFTGSGTFPKGFYYWDSSPGSWKAIVGVKKIDDLSDGKSDIAGSSIFLGIGAGANDASTTNRNIGIGLNSLNANMGGTFNTAVGYKTLQNNISGNSNTAIGAQSLTANIGGVNVGNYNTATGSQSLMANTSGSSNTANGFRALYLNTTASNNTAIGSNALKNNNEGMDNTAIGFESLLNNTTGANNTAIGVNSLKQNITGDSNTSNGHGSLETNTTGNSNTATGYQSLSKNTSGSGNTANGAVALFTNTIGQLNTATGFGALNKNTSGEFNTANGSSALFFNTSGNYNTAYGNIALYKLNSGEKNTAIGFEALTKLTIGDNNTAIGKTTGINLLEGYDNVLIGSNSGGTGTSYSNRLYIENTNSDTPLIYGEFDTNLLRFYAKVEVNTGSLNVDGGTFFVDEVNDRVGVGTIIPSSKLQIVGGTDAELANNTGYIVIGPENGENIVMDSNEIMARNNGAISTLYLQKDGGNVYAGSTLLNTSDRRLKKDITPLSYGLKEIVQLEPKSYFWKNREQEYKSIGLIAQEVQPIIKEIVHIKDDAEKSLSISYIELIPILINAIKEQEVKIQELEQQLSKNSALEARLDKLEAQLEVNSEPSKTTEKVARNDH